MVSYLMAGMWILLRNPHNRMLLQTIAETGIKDDDGAQAAALKGFSTQVEDALDLYDVN